MSLFRTGSVFRHNRTGTVDKVDFTFTFTFVSHLGKWRGFGGASATVAFEFRALG